MRRRREEDESSHLHALKLVVLPGIHGDRTDKTRKRRDEGESPMGAGQELA